MFHWVKSKKAVKLTQNKGKPSVCLLILCKPVSGVNVNPFLWRCTGWEELLEELGVPLAQWFSHGSNPWDFEKSFDHGEGQAQTQGLVHSRECVRCYLCPSSLGLPPVLTQRCPGNGHQGATPVFRYLGPSEGAEGLSHPQTHGLGGETQSCTSQKGRTGRRGQHQGLTSESTSARAVFCQPTSSQNTFDGEMGDLGLPSHMQQAEPSNTCCRGDFGWAAAAGALLGEQRWLAPARGCALLLARHIIIFLNDKTTS